jgi:predicted phosphodiesterase
MTKEIGIKMKIVSASDLHLEFHGHKENFGLSDTILYNGLNADVLILAGDILNSEVLKNRKKGYRSKLDNVFGCFSKYYKNVIYVMGNHEHYEGDFPKTKELILDFLFLEYSNITLLEKTGVFINGVRFFGGTMWTDLSDPIEAHVARKGMNDYYLVENTSRKIAYRAKNEDDQMFMKYRSGTLLPADTTEDHFEFIKALEEDMAFHNEMNYVVVTHHSPSLAMCDPVYLSDEYNCCYHNNLDNFILDNPRIKRWFCGHTHRAKRLTMGECEIILNPRGYPGELRTEYELAETEL